MTSVDSASTLVFEPPGPGSWSLDATHFPRPATRYWTEMHPDALKRGFRDFTRYYGMLIDGLDYAYINSFAYTSMQPAPPEQIPERIQRAQEVFEGKLWRDQLRDWNETFKPASIKTHRELQAVDPDALDDAALVDYLTRCRDHHQEMVFQHMRFTGAAMVAIGDLLAHASDWTDVPPAELLSMMRGAAPVSAGASDELQGMIAAINGDPVARQLLESDGDPGQVLDQLRGLDSDAGRAVSAYLDLIGYRLLDGFDISGRYALELPDALLRAIRATVDAGGDDTTDVGGRGEGRRGPLEGARGASRRVRRPARRGSPDVPDPRRARRVQRHLGVGHHAARGARRRTPGRAPRRGPRSRAFHRCRL